MSISWVCPFLIVKTRKDLINFWIPGWCAKSLPSARLLNNRAFSYQIQLMVFASCKITTPTWNHHTHPSITLTKADRQSGFPMNLALIKPHDLRLSPTKSIKIRWNSMLSKQIHPSRMSVRIYEVRTFIFTKYQYGFKLGFYLRHYFYRLFLRATYLRILITTNNRQYFPYCDIAEELIWTNMNIKRILPFILSHRPFWEVIPGLN